MRPVLLRLGPFAFSSYWFFVILGGAVAARQWKRDRAKMGLATDQQFWLLLNAVILGAYLGGRVVHLVLFTPFSRPDFWSLAFGLKGGFSILGDIAGGALAIWLFSLAHALSFARLMDYLFRMVPVWDAVGRVGCLLAGCCYGRPSALPWSITYTDPAALVPEGWLGVPLHPSQLYESLGGLCVAAVLTFLLLPRVEAGVLPRGSVAAAGLGLYGVQRFTTELFRADAEVVACGLKPAQLAALAFAAASIILLRRLMRSHASHPL